jgi:hypothetical protein
MAAEYPSTLPDLAALLTDPLSFANFQRLVEEQQAALTTLGTNPQGTYGNLAARVAALEARLAALANTGYRGLRITNQAGTPTTQLVVEAELLTVEGLTLQSVAATIDLTASGKNGRTGARATNTWYYIWVGANPATGEVCGVVDTSAARAGIDVSHVSLAGFTAWRRVGARRTNATGSGEWLRATQTDGWVLYQALTAHTTGGLSATANAVVARSIATAVPPTSRLGLIAGELAAGTTNVELRVYETGTSPSYRLLASEVRTTNSPQLMPLSDTQSYDWSCTETVTNAVYQWVDGYYESL